MNKMLTRFLGAALLLCSASVAMATQYPPGTVGGTLPGPYPDTLTIVNLQDPLAVPFLAIPDTAYGIRGIITGFDAKPTGFALYIQDATGNPYTGIDVFTGAFNKQATPYSFALGDLVVVYGKKQEFGGGTELEGLDNSSSTDDCIVRKISSGNTLPPFYVGTTTNLNELPTNTNGEKYEGMLVRINGPLKVARTSAQTPGIGTNSSFIVVSAAAPSDSVFIDGNTLATYAPPALGTIIDLVQGIYEQRTRGYRIQLRDGNDISVATPPNVNDAYPVADNQIRVVFDRNVTPASATNLSNYSLASFGSIDAAVMDGTTAAIVTITNGLVHGDIETITVNGVTGLANNLTMTTPQSRTFVNGVLSCAELEAPQTDSLALAFPACTDKSRFAGSGGQLGQGVPGIRVSIKATAVAEFNSLYYVNDENQALRGGVSVFAPSAPLTPGRRYRLVGQTQEFFGETEFVNTVEVTDLGAGTLLAGKPVTVANAERDTCDSGQTLTDGEDYEGMLVKLSYVKVVQKITPLPTTGFHVAGPNPTFGDTIFVSNLNSSLTPFVHPALGTVVSVTGALHYSNSSFRVCPRNYGDIITHGLNVNVTPGTGKVRFAALQNPSVRPLLAFSLPVEAVVELGVYDVSGRELVTLEKTTLPAGEYTRAWDGRTSTGVKTGAGVYFYRLKVNGETYNTRSIKLAQ
ncbi:MAG: T9SS type A sorting domain-containing protein [Candidatus Eisenbacteria bacterium]